MLIDVTEHLFDDTLISGLADCITTLLDVPQDHCGRRQQGTT